MDPNPTGPRPSAGRLKLARWMLARVEWCAVIHDGDFYHAVIYFYMNFDFVRFIRRPGIFDYIAEQLVEYDLKLN